MKYNGYLIYANDYKHSKFPNFDFLFHNLNDCDEPQGAGNNIFECKKQIDKIISEKDYNILQEEKIDYAIRFSNWLDKNYIKKKGAYYHKGDWEFSNGENNKKKLISIFNRNVAPK